MLEWKYQRANTAERNVISQNMIWIGFWWVPDRLCHKGVDVSEA